ncbi:E3 ubiquitin-protein ligase TRIM32 [Gossypium arboreum]|uniref:E3 ubiquitin-protein ligase TRIM32 n=1 Tax=Gossypium arboreum TaxID=29729 RepID=A0A0B0PFB9_GOSAR|nr:E3 ubiquitin-protein ligase TRIM32 [Gossypium arboreum]
MKFMWGFASNAIASIGLKNSKESSRACSEFSDDDVCSNGSRDEGLECPICWESFNIVENVPYVLWCGHTLCQNCILGLQPAVLKLPTSQFEIPLFVSCPWCHLLSLRLVYKGNLKFPSKNFFLLWMIESLNGDRYGVVRRASPGDNQCNLMLGNQASSGVVRRELYAHGSQQIRSGDNGGSSNVERHHHAIEVAANLLYKLEFPKENNVQYFSVFAALYCCKLDSAVSCHLDGNFKEKRGMGRVHNEQDGVLLKTQDAT